MAEIPQSDTDRPWTDYTYVVFDTETSGAYPVGNEIVEIGAVKWTPAAGQMERFTSLLKPEKLMSDFIIGIHGISNEMVAGAPKIDAVLPKFMEFLGDAVLVAHHAPFDVGFLTYELERLKMRVPRCPILCTSLLARRLVPESPNHRLQTLVKELKLTAGTAHRAMDDADACRDLLEVCLKRVGEKANLKDVAKKMGKKLQWQDYYLLSENQGVVAEVVKSLQAGKDLEFVYDGGSSKGMTRRMTALGVVRNPDGDYIQGVCHIDRASKRFYLSRIKDAQVVDPVIL